MKKNIVLLGLLFVFAHQQVTADVWDTINDWLITHRKKIAPIGAALAAGGVGMINLAQAYQKPVLDIVGIGLMATGFTAMLMHLYTKVQAREKRGLMTAQAREYVNQIKKDLKETSENKPDIVKSKYDEFIRLIQEHYPSSSFDKKFVWVYFIYLIEDFVIIDQINLTANLSAADAIAQLDQWKTFMQKLKEDISGLPTSKRLIDYTNEIANGIDDALTKLKKKEIASPLKPNDSSVPSVTSSGSGSLPVQEGELRGRESTLSISLSDTSPSVEGGTQADVALSDPVDDDWHEIMKNKAGVHSMSRVIAVSKRAQRMCLNKLLKRPCDLDLDLSNKRLVTHLDKVQKNIKKRVAPHYAQRKSQLDAVCYGVAKQIERHARLKKVTPFKDVSAADATYCV